jgi:hypothetical protein
MIIHDQSGTQASMGVSCFRLVQHYFDAQFERDRRMTMYDEGKKMKAGLILTITVM